MVFQRGERITLVHTDDPHTRLRPGDQGTVTRHDQHRTGEVVHVAWDDGSSLAMCLDAGDIIARIPEAPAGPPPDRATPGCLLGELHTDGHRYTCVPVARPTEPGDMIPALRHFWRHTADGEPGRLYNWVLGEAWLVFDPTGQLHTAGGERIDGIGVVDPNPAAPVPAHGDLHRPAAGPDRPGWAYLYDPDWEQILVYEATVHGRWALHSRHDLHAPPASPLAGPQPPAGDAATAAGHTHRWRQATVALPGLDEAWPAQICTIEHRRGQVVARLDPQVLAAVIPLAESLHRDRRPGSVLPTLVLDTYIPQGLQVSWYPGSGHEQTQRIEPDPDRRLVIGPHILPWTLPADTIGGDHTALVNGVPGQVREWVTEAGFHACNPELAGYPLPLVCAAIAACCPHMTAVLATSTTDLGGPVWLVGASHALLLTPTSHRPTGGRVRLPRPLAGTWAADPPVQVLTAHQVATTCAAIEDGFTALTGATTSNPPSTT
jgi:uncharacterized protein DUF4314